MGRIMERLSSDYCIKCFSCGKKVGVFTIVGEPIFGSPYMICMDCLPEWIRRAEACDDNFIDIKKLAEIQEFLENE